MDESDTFHIQIKMGGGGQESSFESLPFIVEEDKLEFG